MSNINYKIFSIILLAISICLFLAFILSSIFIHINQPSLSLQLDSNGFSNFLKIYSPSLQIGTSAIIFFTLWLTFERMKQTQRQLEINQENVKFNNYYKHREEFNQFINKMPFFNFIKEHSQIPVDTLIPAIYSYFFNKSYTSFEPRLNTKSKEEIDNFIKDIKNSSLSNFNQDLEQVPIEEIKKLSEFINRTIDPICHINSEIEIVTVRQHFIEIGGPLKLIRRTIQIIKQFICNYLFV